MRSAPNLRLRIWLAVLVGIITNLYFCADVFATPAYLVRQEVAQILRSGYTSTNQNHDIYRLRALLSQSPGDARLTTQELLRIVRLGASEPSPQNQSNADMAFRLLNSVDYPWSEPDSFEICLNHIRFVAPSSSTPWSILIEMAEQNPNLIPRIMNMINSVPASQRLTYEGSLITALSSTTVSAKSLNTHWRSPLLDHRWVKDLMTHLRAHASFYTSHANDVGWVRSLFIVDIVHQKLRNSFLDTALSSGHFKPLHPDLEKVFATQSGAMSVRNVSLMNNSAYIRGLILDLFRKNPEVLTIWLSNEISTGNASAQSDFQSELARHIFPLLDSIARPDLIHQLMRAVTSRREVRAFILHPEFAQYILREFARIVERSRSESDPNNLVRADEKFILRALEQLPSPCIGCGFEQPEVQAAVLHIYEAGPDFILDFSIMKQVLARLMSDVPIENYTPQTKAYLLLRAQRQHFGYLKPIIKRLLTLDRNLRDETLRLLQNAIAGKEWYAIHDLAELLDDFYPSIPDVKNAVHFVQPITIYEGSESEITERVEDWILHKGMPGYSFFSRTHFGFLMEPRIQNPTLLLASPFVPSRMLTTNGPPFPIGPSPAINPEATQSLPLEEELLRLGKHYPGTAVAAPTRPGITTVTAFFNDNVTAVGETVYNIIHAGGPYSSSSSIERIQRIRNGHIRRNALLDQESLSRNNRFVLDPIPQLKASHASLQAKIRAQRQTQSSSGAANRNSQLPLLTPAENAVIESSARAQIIEAIIRLHPPKEIISPTGRIVLMPDRYLNQPPYAQDYHRLVDHLTQEARARKARAWEQPPEIETQLWRERQVQELRAQFRQALATMITDGHGSLVYAYDGNNPEGFAMNTNVGALGGSALENAHTITRSDLEKIDLAWNSIHNEPEIILSGKKVSLRTLFYLPRVPLGMEPDAISAYIMTEPEARSPTGQPLSNEDLLRETLFRRSVPLLVQYYAQAIYTLNPRVTSDNDLAFQLDHLAAVHDQSRSVRWIPHSAPAHAQVLEAFLWSEPMGEALERERQLRRNNAATANIATAYLKLYQDAQDLTKTSVGPRSTASITKENLEASLRSGTNATNKIPSENILFRVAYQGSFNARQKPTHFFLGQRE